MMGNSLSKVLEGFPENMIETSQSGGLWFAMEIQPHTSIRVHVCGYGIDITRMITLTLASARFPPHVCKMKLGIGCSKWAVLNDW